MGRKKFIRVCAASEQLLTDEERRDIQFGSAPSAPCFECGAASVRLYQQEGEYRYSIHRP